MIALKYRTKLLIFGAIITLIPILGIGTFFITRISSVILEQSEQETIHQVAFIGENLEYAIGLVENLSDAIYLNEPLQRSLVRSYDNQGDSADAYTDYIYPIIRQNRTLHHTLISELSIYINNEDFLKNGQEIKYADQEIRKMDWYNKVVNSPVDGYRIWASRPHWDNYQNDYSKYYLSYYRKLNNYAGKLAGVLLIELKEEYFYNQFFKEVKDKKIYILNPSKNVISSNNREVIGRDGKDVLPYIELLGEGEGVFDYKSNSKTYSIVYKKVSTSASFGEWMVISVVPEALLLEKVNDARNVGVLMCIGIMVIIFVIVAYFSKSMTNRINQLEISTRAVVEGDYTSLVEVSGSDEISDLSHNFNYMLDHLNTLINEVMENELQMRKSKIKQHETEFIALQNQINPHFIYNTLDAIRMNALLADDMPVADMLVALSRLLRYNISKSGQYVTLEEEIHYVEDYIKLMNIRYCNTISLQIQVPEFILKEMVLKLMLQPIVENCIKHGFNKQMQGTIIIRAQVNDDGIIIEIEDDGYGIDDKGVIFLNSAFKKGASSSEKNSIGLSNVNNRLRLRFGEEYGLSIVSVLNKKTIVILKMSYIREGI